MYGSGHTVCVSALWLIWKLGVQGRVSRFSACASDDLSAVKIIVFRPIRSAFTTLAGYGGKLLQLVVDNIWYDRPSTTAASCWSYSSLQNRACSRTIVTALSLWSRFLPLIKMIWRRHSEIVPVNCVVDLLIREKPQAVILFGVFDVLRAVWNLCASVCASSLATS